MLYFQIQRLLRSGNPGEWQVTKGRHFSISDFQVIPVVGWWTCGCWHRVGKSYSCLRTCQKEGSYVNGAVFYSALCWLSCEASIAVPFMYLWWVLLSLNLIDCILRWKWYHFLGLVYHRKFLGVHQWILCLWILGSKVVQNTPHVLPNTPCSGP